MTEPPPPPEQPSPQPGSAQPGPVNPAIQLPPAVIAQLLAASAARQGLPYAGTPVMVPIGVTGLMPQAQMQQSVQLWQGQFPPPEAIERFEKVLPGCFDRMMRMAENLQVAQVDESKRAQEFTHNDAKRGHWLGFAASCLSTLGSIICVGIGAHYGMASAFFVATALVSVPAMAVAKALIESVRSPAAPQIVAASPPQPPAASTNVQPAAAPPPDAP